MGDKKKLKLGCHVHSLEVVEDPDIGDGMVMLSNAYKAFAHHLAVQIALGKMDIEKAREEIRHWLETERDRGITHVTIIHGMGEN